jgi:hypothetical protein
MPAATVETYNGLGWPSFSGAPVAHRLLRASAYALSQVRGALDSLARNGGESPKSAGTHALSERTTRILPVMLAALRMPLVFNH